MQLKTEFEKKSSCRIVLPPSFDTYELFTCKELENFDTAAKESMNDDIGRELRYLNKLTEWERTERFIDLCLRGPVYEDMKKDYERRLGEDKAEFADIADGPRLDLSGIDGHYYLLAVRGPDRWKAENYFGFCETVRHAFASYFDARNISPDLRVSLREDRYSWYDGDWGEESGMETTTEMQAFLDITYPSGDLLPLQDDLPDILNALPMTPSMPEREAKLKLKGLTSWRNLPVIPISPTAPWHNYSSSSTIEVADRSEMQRLRLSSATPIADAYPSLR